MGYNTDWNGQLKTNRAFTTQELIEWEVIVEERHDDEFKYGDERREFPSIWCGFEIKNITDDSGTYGVFRWMGHEKTYQGKEWTIFFLQKCMEWSHNEEIYAEGVLEWRGDEEDDMGALVIEKASDLDDEGAMMMMHIEKVEFSYKREKTAYIYDAKKRGYKVLKSNVRHLPRRQIHEYIRIRKNKRIRGIS